MKYLILLLNIIFFTGLINCSKNQSNHAFSVTQILINGLLRSARQSMPQPTPVPRGSGPTTRRSIVPPAGSLKSLPQPRPAPKSSIRFIRQTNIVHSGSVKSLPQPKPVPVGFIRLMQQPLPVNLTRPLPQPVKNPAGT